MESFIRQYAASIGIDPEIAMRVVLSEGGVESLTDVTRQALGAGPSGREKSYGPLQMNIEGGLGARALAQNIDPRKPEDAYKAVKFGLDTARNEGWGAWYGWKGDPYAGIKGGVGNILNTVTGRKGEEEYPMPVAIPDAAPSSVVATDTPAPQSESEGWAAKLKNMAEGEDAAAFAANLSGKEEGSEGTGLYRGDEPIQSILPSLEAGDAARAQAAQMLMARLLAPKRPRGLTLTGVQDA
jgi:hypothetical protein